MVPLPHPESTVPQEERPVVAGPGGGGPAPAHPTRQPMGRRFSLWQCIPHTPSRIFPPAHFFEVMCLPVGAIRSWGGGGGKQVSLPKGPPPPSLSSPSLSPHPPPTASEHLVDGSVQLGDSAARSVSLLSHLRCILPDAQTQFVGSAPSVHSLVSGLPQQSPLYPPPPLYKLRPCPSYSRRRDCINLGPNFNSVPNVVQPHKTWVW